jgi:hypothetical protein
MFPGHSDSSSLVASMLALDFTAFFFVLTTEDSLSSPSKSTSSVATPCSSSAALMAGIAFNRAWYCSMESDMPWQNC